MGWLSIILAVIQAIPALFKIIEMIRDALKDRPAEVRSMYAAEMKGILGRWKQDGDTAKATGEMQSLLNTLHSHAKRKKDVA